MMSFIYDRKAIAMKPQKYGGIYKTPFDMPVWTRVVRKQILQGPSPNEERQAKWLLRDKESIFRDKL